MTSNSIKKLCLFLSVILYIMSLGLPAARIPDLERGLLRLHYGYNILYTGWLGLLSFQPAWLANPLYLIALMYYDSKNGRRFAGAAFILALFSPFIITEKLLIGFYIWLSSFIVLLYGSRLNNCDDTL